MQLRFTLSLSQAKALCALCATILLLSLCACGGGGSDVPGEQTAATSSEQQAPEPAQLHAPVLASINPQLPPPVVASK